MQLLHNRHFEVLVDHKAIEYMIKSKFPTTRLKTLLLKLSEYTIDLKYQKGSEMHTSDALSRLQNITDTPDNKDITEQAYSHLVENLYTHKTKSLDTTQVKRKHGRPSKAKLDNSNPHLNSTTAATTHTTQPCKATETLDNDTASRELAMKINASHEKSDRLTVTKLNNASKPYKQDYKSKLMTE